MFPIVFKQLKPQVDIRNRSALVWELMLFAVWVLVFVAMYLYPVLKHGMFAIIVLLAMMALRRLVMGLRPDMKRRGVTQGRFTMEERQLRFLNGNEEEVVPYGNIAGADLCYNAYRSPGNGDNGRAELQIKLLDGSGVVIKFLVETRAQMESLRTIWKELYRSGLSIREYLGNRKRRTILFYRKLNAETLRWLKKELHREDIGEFLE